MNKIFLSLLFLGGLVSANAEASVNYSKGVYTINTSGGDSDQWSGNGGSAGSVTLNLTYSDATKTAVVISGTQWGKTFSQTIPLSELKKIQVYARGGNGANGYPGDDGYDGYDGYDGAPGADGYDGCPPGDGGRGGDGTNGGNGTDGGPGGNGGRGGNGGMVHVVTSADQNELMSFVAIDVTAGSGGDGGSGGRGGSGGLAGNGGPGGRGGRSTCTDENGNKTGFDGSDGWSGNSGWSGSSGSTGWGGSGGNAGTNGGWSFDLTTPGMITSYTDRYSLQVTASAFTDDTGDGILEPGERVYLTSLTITNKGKMPTAVAQNIVFSFVGTETLRSPTTLTATLQPLDPGASQTLYFKKGALPLVVPDRDDLIGKVAAISAKLAINNVTYSRDLDTGLAIKWPVSMSTTSKNIEIPFEAGGTTVSYVVKNVGSAPLGNQGDQSLFVEISWSSKTVPGEDVMVTLADGRMFTLAQSYWLTDFNVPANATAPLAMNVIVRDSKAVASANGVLSISLRLRDFNSGSQDIVQTIATNVSSTLDTSLIVWNQTLNLNNARIFCQFPSLTTAELPISEIAIAKAKGTSKLQVQVGIPTSSEPGLTPAITLTDSRLINDMIMFRGSWTGQNALDFLNRVVSPNTPKGTWGFKSCVIK